MAKTTTKEKAKTAPPQEPPADNLPAVYKMRLPFPKSLELYAGIDQRGWQVLIDTTFPGARTVEAVCMAIAYCKNRNLDIFKRPIHIVPIWSKVLDREIESIWPGIAEVRITAMRTEVYAGKDATEFGDDYTEALQNIDSRNNAVRGELEITYPEWARITVYKIVKGVRCAFVGPKVYWKEAYATENRYSDIPNDMWANRPSGQLEKCAEAAALRAAFPEELGNEYTAEEMHGKVIEGRIDNAVMQAEEPETMTPPRPQKSEFERKPDATVIETEDGKPDAPSDERAETKPSAEPDGRPAPPPVGAAIAGAPLLNQPESTPFVMPKYIRVSDLPDDPPIDRKIVVMDALHSPIGSPVVGGGKGIAELELRDGAWRIARYLLKGEDNG